MGQNRGAGCGWGGRPEATAAGRWRGPGGGPPAVAKYRRGGRGSCPCAGGSAEAQLGSGQVTPLENCRPSPAARLERSPRDHVQLRRVLGASDGAFQVRHVPQPDGDGFPRAG